MAKNINKILKQAQKMQSQLLKAQDEFSKKEFEGTAGGGMVTIKLNGSGELQSIKLNPEIIDPDDVEMIEDLIIAAFQNANEQVKESSNSTFGNMSSGMNLPGLS